MNKETLLKIIGTPVLVFFGMWIAELIFNFDMEPTGKVVYFISTTILLYILTFTNFIKKHDKDK
ncbi:hypothetical protein [Halobacillus campisalis]|uniref:Group-specific protein n=1 Tax=Halobacillus campisalis TaxID=435909 RepID=A0ABW2K0V1_9BACI|nr:hypothetical protein [Halobacillus campisalis]